MTWPHGQHLGADSDAASGPHIVGDDNLPVGSLSRTVLQGFLSYPLI